MTQKKFREKIAGTADHTPHSFENFLIDQIISIDPDLHVSDREIEISKKIFNNQNSPSLHKKYNTNSKNSNQNRNGSNSIEHNTKIDSTTKISSLTLIKQNL